MLYGHLGRVRLVAGILNYFRVGSDVSVVCIVITHRLLSSSFLELPY